jgi:biotin carboxyl carrier protein
LKREITVDGRTYHVEVSEYPIGSPFSMKVNDKLLEVTLDQVPDNAKSFSIKVNKKSYPIELAGIEKGMPFRIKVKKILFNVEIKLPVSTPKTTIAAPSPFTVLAPKTTRSAGEGVVTAPMAGKIISIKVKRGESVKMGSVLCVLEAMKMENEITSPKSGVVEEIMVQEGKAVNEGDALVQVK